MKTSINYPAHNRTRGNLYVFDIRYHQEFATPQPVEVKFEFSPAAEAAVGLTGYAVTLIDKVISKNGDGQRQFDIT